MNRTTTTTLVKSALLSGALLAFTSGVLCAEQMAKKGTTPYVTHFIFRPLMSIDIAGLGTATNLEAVGTTQNIVARRCSIKCRRVARRSVWRQATRNTLTARAY